MIFDFAERSSYVVTTGADVSEFGDVLCCQPSKDHTGHCQGIFPVLFCQIIREILEK